MIGYIFSLTEVMLDPESFYRRMRTEGGFGEPLTFAAINLIIGGLLNTIFGSVFSCTNIFLGNSDDFIDLIITTLIVTPALGIITILFWGVIQLVLFRMVGGKGSYEGTVRVLSFATSVYLLTWIPLIGWLFSLYHLYLNIVGGENVHRISFASSAVVVVFPYLLLVIMVFLFSATLLALMLN